MNPFRAGGITWGVAPGPIHGWRRGFQEAMGVATVEITQQNFEQTIERGGIVLIDFWAAWCGPCRMFAPTYEKVAARHPDLVFGKVDTEAQQALAASFDIRSIPTLVILRDKVMVFSQAGALPEADLEDLIRQVRALDMEKVRAEIEGQEKGSSRVAEA